MNGYAILKSVMKIKSLDPIAGPTSTIWGWHSQLVCTDILLTCDKILKSSPEGSPSMLTYELELSREGLSNILSCKHM